MKQLAVAPLSDGRLQLWAIGYVSELLYSAWQTSLNDPPQWTSLQQFDPTLPGTGSLVVAGHSAGGLIQVWCAGKGDTLIAPMSTWKSGNDPNAAWIPWQPFTNNWPQVAASTTSPELATYIPLMIIAVAQLSDGRMQIFAAAGSVMGPMPIIIAEKASIAPNAAWTTWTDFKPEPPWGGAKGDIFFVGSLADGRLQAWISNTNDLYSSWQTTVSPGATWSNWTPFPVGGSNGAQNGAAACSNGITSVWMIDGNSRLWATQKTSSDPNSSWAEWGQFDPDPGPVTDVTAGVLSDGNLQIFVTTALAQDQSAQVLTITQPVHRRRRRGAPVGIWQSIGSLPG